MERKTLWLTPEQIADRGVPHVVELMNGSKSLFLDAEPTDGDDANYKVIVIVFTDLSADRAQGAFDEPLTPSSSSLQFRRMSKMESCSAVLQRGNKGAAIYNSSFRPFQSPVPFLFVRQGVISDWKFFLGNQNWLN